jgi:hypothetical protein
MFLFVNLSDSTVFIERWWIRGNGTGRGGAGDRSCLWMER